MTPEELFRAVLHVQVIAAELAAAEECGRNEVLRAHDGWWSDERVRVEIRDAEERGRRLGVEERDGLRARVLIGTDKILHLYALDDGTPLRAWLEGLRLSDAGFSDGDEVLITRVALAPRDSGKDRP